MENLLDYHLICMMMTMVIINEQRKEKKRESFFFSSHSFSIILRLDALRLSTMTMMNENFIKPNHALIVR